MTEKLEYLVAFISHGLWIYGNTRTPRTFAEIFRNPYYSTTQVFELTDSQLGRIRDIYISKGYIIEVADPIMESKYLIAKEFTDNVFRNTESEGSILWRAKVFGPELFEKALTNVSLEELVSQLEKQPDSIKFDTQLTNKNTFEDNLDSDEESNKDSNTPSSLWKDRRLDFRCSCCRSCCF